MSMDYDHAAAYTRRMLDTLNDLSDASNFAYQNGRDDVNPVDDLMVFMELLTAAASEREARDAFVYICEKDVEMPSAYFEYEPVHDACANLLDELERADIA